MSRLVQREMNYAIVDEVDNILIDEARTPLIISGQAQKAQDDYSRFAAISRQLRVTIPTRTSRPRSAASTSAAPSARVERSIASRSMATNRASARCWRRIW